MSLFVFSLAALPVWLAFAGLYFHLRADRSKVRLLAKCGGTFLAVCSAGVALYLRGENPAAQVIFWFFALCMAADALLEIAFVPGMLLFGAAHVCLIVHLWMLYTPTLWSVAVWVVAYGVVAILFRRDIPSIKRKVLPAFLLYPAILGFALALALPMPFVAEGSHWMVALGMLCFFISDMMVAKQALSKVPKGVPEAIMALYWGALYLISGSLW